jgi:hypothetical protein
VVVAAGVDPAAAASEGRSLKGEVLRFALVGCRQAYAFDVLELDGRDLRGQSWDTRRALLTQLLDRCQDGLRLSEHIADTDGELSSDRHVSWVSKASSPNGATGRTGPGAAWIGSK